MSLIALQVFSVMYISAVIKGNCVFDDNTEVKIGTEMEAATRMIISCRVQPRIRTLGENSLGPDLFRSGVKYVYRPSMCKLE